MAAIVTSTMRSYAAQQFLNGFNDPTENIYLFIGATLPWASPASDLNPPTPIDSENHIAAAFRSMISLKNISSANVSLVVPRNNWTPGTVYTQYSNLIDLFDPALALPPFYVLTSNLNVYKCLNNNKGSASTAQPTGTSLIPFTTSDLYQWKYMFTINPAAVLSFVTTEWFPVYTLTGNDGSQQWQVQVTASTNKGTVDRIDMVASGTQYTTIPTVTILGDGIGATALATLSGTSVSGITVTGSGKNYTWATVVISGGGIGANGASANAVVSPFGGHGADPVTELGAFYVLADTQLVYGEPASTIGVSNYKYAAPGGTYNTFTTSNDYRQIGILQDPLLNDGETPATALDYDQSTRLTLTSTSGTFANDETVTGSTSLATGIVLDWDGVSFLRLVQVVGTFTPGELLSGTTSGATGVLQSFTGTATGGSSTTITFPTSASTTNNFYTGQTIKITGGTGGPVGPVAGQTRLITQYLSTRVATVSEAWVTPPNSTSVFSTAVITPPDLAPFVGKIVYLENRRPIVRASDQVENIKVTISF